METPTTKTATGQQVVLPKTDQTNSRIGILAGIIGVLLTGLGFIGINKKKHD
ncbi:LPXTG cell wall anchor domain-containing protein [Periweissella fabalis]|uniref:LPXTG cell wall anchor domain-containing protein n=1 Tax=Periweissella fabalis TaxID=1070421 RepID=A0A7X6S2B7_9LACO|nr:LPXTG cell wall anchor domain-containing protein [Periweissella fabalis]NKZ23388.1 LPXTG cell wall anchor domain-containing protein [Periweissella fabalis]